jgi:hypothetical protein
LRGVRNILASFMANSEDATATTELEVELPKILEIVEILKRSKSTPLNSKEQQLSTNGDPSKTGTLILDKYDDVIKDYCRVE